MLKSLKRIDGFAFALFAAVCAVPFFAPFSRLDFSPRGHIDRGMLLVLISLVFILARFAAAVGQRGYGLPSAWIWLAGLYCVPLFSTLGIATFFYVEGESHRLLTESYGMVSTAPPPPLTSMDFTSGLMGLLVIWIGVTSLYVGPLCLAGTAIFAGLHWLFRTAAGPSITKQG
jgi:hypothetical protein